MNTNNFIIFALFIAVSLLKAELRKPNIIVFLVDDMGLMDTSAPMLVDENGKPKRYPLNDWYRTPNMERLAAQGVRFSNFYSHNVCSPTRVSMMNGQNSARHRCTDYIFPWKNNREIDNRSYPLATTRQVPPEWNWVGLKGSDVTLPNLFRKAGYQTIHVGKAHFAPKDREGENPLNLGFDVNVAGTCFGAPGSYYGTRSFGVGSKNLHARPVPHLEKYHGQNIFLTEALTLEAKAEIDKALNASKPFFLHMSHYAVHSPFQSDPRFAKNYQGKSPSLMAYATMIEGMDKSLGDLMDHIKTKGVAENTLIIFLGDNGGDAPDKDLDGISSCAPLRGRKGAKWEGGIRVPFIASWGKVNPENAFQKDNPIVSNSMRQEFGTCFDLLPTLCKVAHIKIPKSHKMDGQELGDLFAGKSNSDHRDVFLNHYPHPRRGKSQFFTTWRNGDWKVIYEYLNSGPKRYSLFNLKNDISESNNLAEKRPDKLRKMMTEMVDELTKMKALYPVKDGKVLKPVIPGAIQSLTETQGSGQPATISALADIILKEKEPRIRLAAIQALDAFDWSANTYALAALVLAREENGAKWPHFKPATRALTSEEMAQRNSYDHAWDFDTVWMCRKVDAHPVLQKQAVAEEKIHSGGTGTADDPFLVATAAQLDDIRNKLGSDKHFRQVCDIDLTGYGDSQKGWDPIGRGEAIGSYDGGGYTIRNLFINRPGMDNVGLFGSLTWGKDDTPGRFTRIALENASIVGRKRTGTLAGSLGDAHAKASDQTMIKDCYATGTVTGADIVGGLVGQVFSCKVSHCHVAVTVGAKDGLAAPFVQSMSWGGSAQNCFYNADLAGTENVAIAALRALRSVEPKMDLSSHLFKLLRSDDAFLRVKAAEVAQGIPQNPELVNALLDDRYEVRRLAGKLANSYGNKSKQQIIATLTETYDPQGDSHQQCRQLVRAAGELSCKASIEFLIQALTDSRADVRRTAIEGLQWMGITDPSKNNIIGPHSFWWSVRPEEAERTAAALQTMAANDSDASCREAAAAALARITGKGLFPQKPVQAVLSKDVPIDLLPEAEKKLLKTIYTEVDDCRQAVLEKYAAGVAWPFTTDWAKVCHASAHLYLNRNLEAANRRLMGEIELGSYSSEVGGLAAPLYSVVYGLYNSRSPHLPGRLTSETEQLFKQRFFTYLKWNSRKSFDNYINDIWKLKGTENHHVTFGPLTWYLYLGYLKQDPEYAQRELYDGKTVTQWCDAWADYWKQWLEARALNGLWIEMGASYAKYSYTGILALYVGAEDPQVRQRAEMFLDLSFIEEAQISYGNMRGGSKSRAGKKPESSITFLLPVLYGEAVRFPGHVGLHEFVISGYRPPVEAMLIRKQYELPETPIIISNRRPGEVDAQGALKAESALVNYAYKTRHFLLGSILCAPDTKTSPLFSQSFWSGLVFASGEGIFPNPKHSGGGRFANPYFSFQHENVMVLQKNKDAYNTKYVGIYVKPKARKLERDGWVFVDDGEAYGAIRVLQGGYHLDDKKANVLPNQEFAPMLIQGGDVDEFGSFDHFVTAVLGNTIKWDGEKVEYVGPNQPHIEYFSRPSGKLPRVAGQDCIFQRAATYESPFLNSKAGTATATVTVGPLKTIYDFKNSEIIRNLK